MLRAAEWIGQPAVILTTDGQLSFGTITAVRENQLLMDRHTVQTKQGALLPSLPKASFPLHRVSEIGGAHAAASCRLLHCTELKGALAPLIGEAVTIFTADGNKSTGRLRGAGDNLIELTDGAVTAPNGPLRRSYARSFLPIAHITDVVLNLHDWRFLITGTAQEDGTLVLMRIHGLIGVPMAMFTADGSQLVGTIERVDDRLITLRNTLIISESNAILRFCEQSVLPLGLITQFGSLDVH